MAKFLSQQETDDIRNSHLAEGISNLKSRIRNMDIEVGKEIVAEERKAEPKYTKTQIAEAIVDIYKTNVKQQSEEEKEEPKANTIASRANIRALSNSLANIRNGGYAGPTTEFTPSANGDVNPGRRRNYNALVVAGTEMTLEEYEAYVSGKFDECWKGYRAQGMKKKGGKMVPNCVKEEEQIDEVTYPSDFVKGSGVAKKKYGRPVQHDQPVKGPMTSPVRKTIDEVVYPSQFKNPDGSTRAVARSDRNRKNMRPQTDDQERDRYGRRKTVDESPVIDELKDKLLEMDDHSWQSIDTVMRKLAKENDMTPKELHKQFKAESNGMIPDDWAKEHALKEEAGWMPLDEAVAINKVGNVYDVSLMWKAHTTSQVLLA